MFFLGVFYKRLNAKGCLSALLVGFTIGVFRLAVDTPVTLGMAGFEQGYPAGSFLWIVNSLYFRYYSVFTFVASAATMIVVSYATEAPAETRLFGLTYGTVTEEHRRESRDSWNRQDVLSSVLVLMLILVVCQYFSR